jgi:hypothetical protein
MKFTAEGEVYFPEINDNDWIIEKLFDKDLFDVFIYKRKCQTK